MQIHVNFYLRRLSKPRFLPHECNEQSSCGTQLLIPQQSYFFYNTLGIMAPSVDNKSKLKTSRSLYKSEQHFVSVASGCAKTQTKNYIWHHEL